jgi:hypothetical protein
MEQNPSALSENSLMFPFSLPENQINLTQGYWSLVLATALDSQTQLSIIEKVFVPRIFFTAY